MVTYGANFGCGGADNEVTAVAAFPHHDAGFFKYCLGFNVVEQCAIAFFVRLFDGSDTAEFFSEIVEAFFVGLVCHASVHIRPFIVLALGSGKKIFGGIAELA